MSVYKCVYVFVFFCVMLFDFIFYFDHGWTTITICPLCMTQDELMYSAGMTRKTFQPYTRIPTVVILAATEAAAEETWLMRLDSSWNISQQPQIYNAYVSGRSPSAQLTSFRQPWLRRQCLSTAFVLVMSLCVCHFFADSIKGIVLWRLMIVHAVFDQSNSLSSLDVMTYWVLYCSVQHFFFFSLKRLQATWFQFVTKTSVINICSLSMSVLILRHVSDRYKRTDLKFVLKTVIVKRKDWGSPDWSYSMKGMSGFADMASYFFISSPILCWIRSQSRQTCLLHYWLPIAYDSLPWPSVLPMLILRPVFPASLSTRRHHSSLHSNKMHRSTYLHSIHHMT